MLDIAIDSSDGAHVITPRGKLTMLSARSFRESVTALLTESDAPLLVVDMSQTEFVDSTGLGALIACLKSARQAGGDLRLAAPSTQLMQILGLTNLDRVLPPRPTVDEALRD